MSTRKNIENNQKPIEESDDSSNHTFTFAFNRSYLIIIVVILVIVGLLFFFKNILIAANVNGKPISRLDIIKRLEKQGGKKELDTVISQMLIEQEAQKRKIVISSNDIDKQYNLIKTNNESQGKNLDQLLSTQGMTVNDLKTQIKLQLMLEKMLDKDIKVTDDEVNKFIEEQKASIPESMKPDEVKKIASNQLKQQKLNQKVQEFIQNLKKNAKINYFVNY